MKNKFYNKIDKALNEYETFAPFHELSIDWICNRIAWCWKWKKITNEEMNSLCDRAIEVLETMRKHPELYIC